jgi:hydrogenase nickel incorporation protein HypA/HybF
VHELGVVIEVVKTVEEFAAKNGVTRIQALVLQIGEISSVIPHYVEACYPAAVDGTILEGSELRIETLSANARCRSCAKVFGFKESGGKCPACGGGDFELLGGREFMIKEIVAC